MAAIASGALCVWCATGFDWPGRSERLSRALGEAKNVREKREALRLLAELDGSLDRATVERALHDADPDVRADALALLSPREPAFALRAAVEDASARVRLAALELVAARRDAQARAVLLRALGDGDAAVRAASARALGRAEDATHDGAVVEALARALEDPAVEVRSEAAAGLGRQGGEAAVAALLRHADDPLPELRAAVASALAHHAEGRVVVALERALDDPDELVVQAALRAYLASRARAPSARLNALAKSASPALADAARRLLARQQSQRDAAPPSSAPWLALLARTADRALTPAQAGELVAAIEHALPEAETLAADPLLEWLPRAPHALQPRIARLIERTRAPIDGRPLDACAADRDPALRAACARLFAQVNARDHRVVRGLLGDPSAQVRAAAVFALANTLGRDDARALASALEDARGEARGAILQALAAGLAGCVHTLEGADRAALAEALLPELEVKDEARASWAAGALAFVGGEHVQAALRRAAAAERSGVRIAALRAGVADASAEARALRRALTAHSHPAVAATALAAMALAGDPLPWSWLYAQIDRAHWPLGPVAAFAIASATMRATTADTATPCALLTTREPATRANAVAALAARPALTCLDEPGDAWLRGGTSWVVRRVAARWASARAPHAPQLRSALEACASREPEACVRAVCAASRANEHARAPESARMLALPSACSASRSPAPPFPPTGPSAQAVASRPRVLPLPVDTSDILAARALVLDDGRVLISWPDGGGRVSWPNLTPIAELSGWLSEYTRE